jgi:hypothetical protein
LCAHLPLLQAPLLHLCWQHIPHHSVVYCVCPASGILRIAFDRKDFKLGVLTSLLCRPHSLIFAGSMSCHNLLRQLQHSDPKTFSRPPSGVLWVLCQASCAPHYLKGLAMLTSLLCRPHCFIFAGSMSCHEDSICSTVTPSYRQRICTTFSYLHQQARCVSS